jgi:endonuclease/exonuclease/phosphatase family metal-dependent hydrolase
MHRLDLLPALLIVGIHTLACSGVDDAAPGTIETEDASLEPFRVLSYNIGNPDDAEPNYPLRLSYQAYEDSIAQTIRNLEPDIVLLQEVLPPQTCDAFDEEDSARTCYNADARPTAAERVLGDDYSIACDARLHVECVGVRKAFGTIQDLEPGEFSLSGAETPPLPLDSCNYAAGTCNNDLCDAESTVSAVTVEAAGETIRVVHMHPNAAGLGEDGFYQGDGCRALQVEQAFEGLKGLGEGDGAALAGEGKTIVAGDFNLDPTGFATDEELAIWDRNVGPGQRFSHFNPTDEDTGDLIPTRRGLAITIDHVVADEFSGDCEVFSEEGGSAPLDSDFDFDSLPGTLDGEEFPGRIDHFALLCTLTP